MANFIVIRYKVEMPLLSFGCSYQWAKVTARKNKDGEYCTSLKDIDRDEALRLIAQYGLKKVEDNEDGKVWDDGEFKEKYGGYIKI